MVFCLVSRHRASFWHPTLRAARRLAGYDSTLLAACDLFKCRHFLLFNRIISYGVIRTVYVYGTASCSCGEISCGILHSTNKGKIDYNIAAVVFRPFLFFT